MTEERILSADSHIVEPADFWTRHIDPALPTGRHARTPTTAVSSISRSMAARRSARSVRRRRLACASRTRNR